MVYTRSPFVAQLALPRLHAPCVRMVARAMRSVVAAILWAVASLGLVSGCSSPPNGSPPEPAPSPATSAAASEVVASRPHPSATLSATSVPHPSCTEREAVETIEIPLGTTVRTSIGVAVTYDGAEHDGHEGGRSDTVAKLTFRGVLDDGRLTPSALSWRTSALAPPTWLHLGSMPLCVRLSKAGSDRVTLEVSRASSG